MCPEIFKANWISLGLNIWTVGYASNGFSSSNPWFVWEISSAFPIYLLAMVIVWRFCFFYILVLLCPTLSTWTVSMVSVVVSKGLCESSFRIRPGLRSGTTCCKGDICRQHCLLRGGEAPHPFRWEAAEFIFVADVSHCRGIITIMKEDYAVLGLWRVY